jgi:cysteinyl-tRNA synthetase
MYPAGAKFGFEELGLISIPAPIEAGIPPMVWEMVKNAPPLADDKPSADVMALADQRQAARASKNWSESDRLRDQIAALGWTVQDTKDGQKLVRG